MTRSWERGGGGGRERDFPKVYACSAVECWGGGGRRKEGERLLIGCVDRIC